MIKNNITIGVFSALILASTVAGAEQKYPAADFQPEVVFQDNDLINKNANSAKAPASAKSVKHETVVTEEVADSKYPAANFKPQVVFHDEKYVAGKSVPSSRRSSNLVADKVDIEKPVNAKAKDSTTNYLIGLIVLAAAGFFLFKKQGGSCKTETSRKSTKAHSAHPGGLTGVAKYVNRISGTGVSRYIDKNVKSVTAAKTGVAKYMAKQVVSTKVKATEAATGVEKYMRNRG